MLHYGILMLEIYLFSFCQSWVCFGSVSLSASSCWFTMTCLLSPGSSVHLHFSFILWYYCRQSIAKVFSWPVFLFRCSRVLPLNCFDCVLTVCAGSAVVGFSVWFSLLVISLCASHLVNNLFCVMKIIFISALCSEYSIYLDCFDAQVVIQLA